MRKLLLIILALPFLLGATYYVDLDNGDNNWSGLTTNFTTATGPFATIDYADSVISPNDTVWVRFTTYPETLTVTNASTTWLGDTDGTVWADSTDYPVIDGEDTRDYCATWAVSTISISGFSFHSSADSAIYINNNGVAQISVGGNEK